MIQRHGRGLLFFVVVAAAFGVGWGMEQALRSPDTDRGQDSLNFTHVVRSSDADEDESFQEVTEVSVAALSAMLEAVENPRQKPLAVLNWIERLNGEQIAGLFVEPYEVVELINKTLATLLSEADEVSIWALMDRWVEVDAEGAKAFADAALASGEKDGSYMALFIYLPWTRQNPEEAKSRLAGVNDELMRQILASGIAASSEPLEAFRIAVEQGLDGEIVESFLPFSSADGEAALAEFQKPGSDVSPEVFSKILERWAAVDPAAVLRASSGIDDEVLRFRAEHGALVALANRDLDAASDALFSLPDLLPRHEGTIRSMVPNHLQPAKLLEWIKRVPDSKLQNVFVNRELHRIRGKVTAETLSEWYALLPEGSRIPGTMSRIAQDMARQDPMTAINWLKEQASGLTPDEQRELDARSIGKAMAEVDLEAASAHFDALPEVARTDYISGVASWIGRHDVGAGHEWIQSLPAKHRDEVRISMLRDAPTITLELANSFLSQVEDPENRLKTAEIITSKLPFESALSWVADVADGPEQTAQVLAGSNVILWLYPVLATSRHYATR
jgi:hypothetical protein